MNKLLTTLIISAILLVVIAMNAYIILRITGLFGIERSWIIYSLIGASFIIFPFASFLVMRFGSIFTRGLYLLSAIYIGVLFFAFFALLLFEVISLFFKVDNRTAGMIILGVVAIISVYSLINAVFIRVRNITVSIPHLDKEMKIVQISDVHLGAIHDYNHMKNIVDKINAQNPDLVLITGDLFDNTMAVPQRTINLLNQIKGSVYSIIGNHDFYYKLNKTLAQLSKTKVRVLRDEKVMFKGVQIIGIDDPASNVTGISGLANINVNKSLPSILISHPPQNLKEASKKGISLQLAGHVHRGQIFPFNLFIHLVYNYTNGIYKEGNTTLYVTSGTGTWGPPMRFLSESEIVVFNLKGK